MRVASYNIRKAVGLDWRRDPDRIFEVLDEIDADVVVLQEADRRIGSRTGVLSLDRVEAELDLLLAISLNAHRATVGMAMQFSSNLIYPTTYHAGSHCLVSNREVRSPSA